MRGSFDGPCACNQKVGNVPSGTIFSSHFLPLPFKQVLGKQSKDSSTTAYQPSAPAIDPYHHYAPHHSPRFYHLALYLHNSSHNWLLRSLDYRPWRAYRIAHPSRELHPTRPRCSHGFWNHAGRKASPSFPWHIRRRESIRPWCVSPFPILSAPITLTDLVSRATENSNIIGNITANVSIPTSRPEGGATISGALFSLYGVSLSATVEYFTVNVTVGNETSSDYVTSEYEVLNTYAAKWRA